MGEDQLRAAGHAVVLVQPLPEIAVAVNTRIMQAVRESDAVTAETLSSVLSVPRSYYDARTGTVRERLQDIASNDPGIMLIDPAQAFCGGKDCYAVREGSALYFDDDHASVYGAGEILRQLPLGLVPVSHVTRSEAPVPAEIRVSD